VLIGSDPEYAGFPLLVFNTGMGAVYLLAALLLWRLSPRGWRVAGTVALANLAVLLAIGIHPMGEGRWRGRVIRR
jgi:hypothetical protein